MFELALIFGLMVCVLAVGMLIGVGLVWDKRFNEGRAYGYQRGCEARRDRGILARLAEK